MDLSVMPKAFSSHHSWYLNTFASVTDSLKESQTISFSPSKFVYTYTNAIHGFSARLSQTELEAIKSSPGYVSSSKDKEVKVDTTHSAQFLGLNSNSGAWPVSNYGKDIIIGLIDTGVWPESESYKDHGMTEVPSRWKGACESGTQFNSSLCNKKLIGARYFNKGLLAKYPNLTIAMNSARDTDGHGTHTSSTAAGNYVDNASYFGYASGTSKGMAPQARIAMYKALWEEGVYLSDIIAAIDQAIIDGVDVLSLSLGIDGVPLYEDPIAIATFAATEKGIFVSTSAGNEGPYLETLHNGTPWVLTVAAGTIDREFLGTITLGNGVSISGLSLYPGNSSVSTQSSIVLMSTCEDQKELKKIGYKIVVCLDKNDTLGEQIYTVRDVNVAGAIFITNNTDLEFFLQSYNPALFLNLEEGEKILNYITSNSDPKASIEFQTTRLGTKPAPQVASYSSRGPSPSCPSVMKPDIMGPGALVLASWTENNSVTKVTSGDLYSKFNIISGTSMSCPHLAGVAALIKATHPKWSPAAIRSAMMTTADVMDNTLKPIGDIGDGSKAASPLAMGSGHVNPNKALDPGLVYDTTQQDYVNLICGMNFTSAQIKAITRSSTYDCSKPSLDLNYPSFIAYFNGNNKTVQEFERTVTNFGDGMSTYNVKLSEMDGLKVSVVPSKLVFSKRYDKKSYKLLIEGSGQLKNLLVSGSVSWVESEGKHVVTSPIVVTRLDVTLSG